MDAEILKRFCAKEDGRYIISVPFIAAGYRWACNGTAIAREPAPGEPDSMPPEKRAYPPALDAWDQWHEPTAPLPPLTGLTKVEKEDCECCEDCTSCDGTGVCTCSRCDDDHTCGTCDGTGKEPNPQCAICGGDGLVSVTVPAPQRIGQTWISGKYARLLHDLPRPVTISVPDKADTTVSFRCPGLEGIIAPTKINEEDARRYSAPVESLSADGK